MRAVLLLVLRSGTAIAVATAAAQFWGLAVRGEAPTLSPVVAFPPTATAVAAVLPRHPPERPASALEPSAGRDGRQAGPAAMPPALAPSSGTRPAAKPKSEPSSWRSKPTKPTTNPT